MKSKKNTYVNLKPAVPTARPALKVNRTFKKTQFLRVNKIKYLFYGFVIICNIILLIRIYFIFLFLIFIELPV